MDENKENPMKKNVCPTLYLHEETVTKNKSFFILENPGHTVKDEQWKDRFLLPR